MTTQAIASGQAFFLPVSGEVRRIVLLVMFVTLCGIISLFGVVSNLANMAVFTRQGFKDSINISFLVPPALTQPQRTTNDRLSLATSPGLAVADLACSITMFWNSICYNPVFQSLDLPIDYVDIPYMTGGWPHVCFNRISSFMTAFITLERCLCVTQPLKVKRIITPFRTKIINIVIFSSMIVMFSPIYFVNKLEWRYNQLRNRTILGLYFTDDRQAVESVSFFIHSVALSCIFLLSVTACTVVLVVKLKQKTKWRKTTVANTAANQDISSVKETKVVKMITLISTIFIVCYIPPTFTFLLMVSFPEFNMGGTLENGFFVFCSVDFVLESVNSSVNIFVYFKMSTKFRVTLVEMFCSCEKL